MKTRTYWIFAIILVSALVVALWSPWLPKSSDRQFLDGFRQSETYRTAMDTGVADIYCKGVELSWVPFGRKIAYCDHAVWLVNIKGDVSLVRFTKYQPNPERNEKLRTFAYYQDNTAHQMCRSWSAHDPVLVTAKYVGVDKPLPTDGSVKTHFKRDGHDFFLIFPYDDVLNGKYTVGDMYSVDMNNLCIYEHHFQKTEPLDREWLKYIMPTPIVD